MPPPVPRLGRTESDDLILFIRVNLRMCGNCDGYARMTVVKDNLARDFEFYYKNVIGDGNK